MPTIRERSGAYQVLIRLQGHAPITETFPILDQVSKLKQRAELEEWGKEVERKLRMGDVPTLQRKELQAWTLGKKETPNLIDRYLECPDFIEKKSAANERVAIEAFRKRAPGLCSKTLDKLTKKDFIDYQRQRQNIVATSTINRELSPLRDMFTLAANGEWEDIPLTETPMKGVKILKEPEPRDRRVSMEELVQIGKGIDKSCLGERRRLLWSSMVLTALHTALRRGELLKIEWRDIDLEKGTLNVRPEVSKTGQRRLLPLTEGMRAELWDYSKHRTSVRVFPITESAHNQGFKRIIKAAGLYIPESERTYRDEQLSFHCLRHEAISRYAEMKLQAEERNYLSGHSYKTINDRYVHIDMCERLRPMLQAEENKPSVEGALRSIFGPALPMHGMTFEEYKQIKSERDSPKEENVVPFPVAK